MKVEMTARAFIPKISTHLPSERTLLAWYTRVTGDSFMQRAIYQARTIYACAESPHHVSHNSSQFVSIYKLHQQDI